MSKKFIIDSNLLLLLVVGSANIDYIGLHKSLRAYSIEDFILLSELIGEAGKLILTPNTLTEASNLLDRIKGQKALTTVLDAFKAVTIGSREEYVASAPVCIMPEFDDLGLADTVLLSLCSKEATLLAADLDLYILALRFGFTAINFNHYRDNNRYA